MNEFLKNSRHHIGRREYADILDLTANTLRLILDGGVNLNKSEDEDMTEEGFDDYCIG